MICFLLIIPLVLQNIFFRFLIFFPTSFCQIVDAGHNFQQMPTSQIRRNDFAKWLHERDSLSPNGLNNNQQTDQQNHYQQRQIPPQQNSWQFPVFQQKQQNYNSYRQPYHLNNQKGLSRVSNNNNGNAGSNEKGEAIVTELKPSSLTPVIGHNFLEKSNLPLTTTNLEHYLNILKKQNNRRENNDKPKGFNTHLIDSREVLIPPTSPFLQSWHLKNITQNGENEEDESLEPFEQQQLLLNGPCLTANCKTWITITIPSELVGIPPGIGISSSIGGRKKEEESGGGSNKQRLVLPPKPSIESKPSMPPFPPKPMPQSVPHRSRGSASPKNRPRGPTSTTDASITISLSSATTKAYPPDFVFSTKWILPVDGRPKNNESSIDNNNSGVNSISSSTQVTSSGRGIESLPFTIRPKSPNALQPKERTSAKRPSSSLSPKPWTHSSSSNSPKSRPPSEKQAPRPPTPDTTIEQAAIWASTELIDAIREALAKFRATLNKHDEHPNDNQHSQYFSATEEFADPEEVERELHVQLQSAWETLRGTWLEQAVEDLAQQTDALGRERRARESSRIKRNSTTLVDHHQQNNKEHIQFSSLDSGNIQRKAIST